ncbi:hypothetical protein OCU04_013270 [Sclerotinia nivalis]|uniref:Uncharacterized protein n=1 Tax=Sclerotinia nivalis TaxID=352851 RepID=A0A9X0DCJ0_9HELO|nr:hypothetical protein OCU04_013270 [Sclerotinia nivalis]
MAKKTDSVVPINRVLAEITFAPKMTYYDISAIDNQTDNSGIRFISPYGLPQTKYFRPGCDWFPCDNAYLKPEDPHTRTTFATDFLSLQRAHDSIRGRFGLGLPSVSAT